MTGIITIRKETMFERFMRKMRVRFLHRCPAATFGLVDTPEYLKGEPSVAIRFAPYSNINLLSDMLVHETLHAVLLKNFDNDTSLRLDRVDGDIDAKDYLWRDFCDRIGVAP